MGHYFKDYAIEFREECEADSFKEAEKVLDAQAKKNYPGEDITHYEIELEDEK